jgi:hypothetical protein
VSAIPHLCQYHAFTLTQASLSSDTEVYASVEIYINITFLSVYMWRFIAALEENLVHLNEIPNTSKQAKKKEYNLTKLYGGEILLKIRFLEDQVWWPHL